jgi:hypothetical protein
MTVHTVLFHSKVKEVLGELQRESLEEHVVVELRQDQTMVLLATCKE